MLEALRKKLLHPPSFWVLNFFAWCGFGLIALLVRYVMHDDLGRAVGLTIVAESVGFLCSGLLRQCYLWIGRGRFLRTPMFAVTLVLTLAMACAQALIVQLLVEMTGWRFLPWSTAERWVLLALLMWIVYMAWSLGYFWVKAELAAHQEAMDATKARGEAQRIELQLLRAQLDPHFLFNSLNGIASEIQPHPKMATGMVRELADYLRYSLEHRDQLVTPLAVELDAAEAYLRIEKARFGERLETEISADAAARAVKVPSFLLQPIVENAVKHGFSSVEPPWRLAISARVASGGLDLEVKNSGLPDGAHHGTGLGLDTIRRRLALHYPARHRFDITGGGGVVTVSIHLEGEPCCV